jgi:hypothetical protein
MTLWLLPLLAFFSLATAASVQAEGASQRESYTSEHRGSQSYSRGGDKGAKQAAKISYDKATDHLSVTAEETSLKLVLARIAQLSGIEVLFDDQADEPLTISIESDSLEEGIKQILKGRNSMLRYSRDDKAQLMLLGVMVLPVGEYDSGRAKRLIAMDDEAYHRVKNELTHEQVQQMDRASERWQTRMNEMSPERREKLEKHINERVLKRIQNEQKQAEIRERHKQEAEKHRAEQLAEKEKDLEVLRPEQRASYKQRGEAAREDVRRQIQLEQQ